MGKYEALATFVEGHAAKTSAWTGGVGLHDRRPLAGFGFEGPEVAEAIGTMPSDPSVVKDNASLRVPSGSTPYTRSKFLITFDQLNPALIDVELPSSVREKPTGIIFFNPRPNFTFLASSTPK